MMSRLTSLPTSRDSSAGGGLQIGDRGDGEQFGRRQFWGPASRAPLSSARMAPAWRGLVRSCQPPATWTNS